MHFDHAPGTPGRDDKFEIAGGAYRLRKSACFQRAPLTCLTCHDPHDIPRGATVVARQVAVCTELPPGNASRRITRSPGRRPGDLHRLPHAEAANRRRGARGDDRPLHPTAARAAIRWRRAPRRTARAGRLPRRSRARLPADAAGDAGERAVSWPWRKCSRARTSRQAFASWNRRLRSTGRDVRSSITSSPAHTRGRPTMRPRSSGAVRRFSMTPASCRR